MAMSRKHYKQVAEIISAELAVTSNHEALKAIRNVTFSLADMFKRDNVNFNRDKFYRACDMSEWAAN